MTSLFKNLFLVLFTLIFSQPVKASEYLATFTHQPNTQKISSLTTIRTIKTFEAFGKTYVLFEQTAPTLHQQSTLELKSLAATLGAQRIEANHSYYLVGGSKPPVDSEIPDDLSDYTPEPVIPNDPSFNKLWGLFNFGQSIQSSKGTKKKDSTTAQAWNFTQGSSEMIAGVMDSGIDYNHEDLRSNLWTETQEDGSQTFGYNAFDNNHDVYDGHSHGTHVSGTIGATGNNQIGVSGINWRVKLASVRIFNASGRTDLATIIRGLDWFHQHAEQIKVINHSWGGSNFSELLSDAFEALDRAGVINVFAAGNDSSHLDYGKEGAQFYPAMYDLENSIIVASHDNKGKRSGFSNYGAKVVHLAAPGSGIYSTVPGGYAYKSGTSMAAPHVTGAVTLLWSYHPDWDAKAIKRTILEKATPWSSLEGVSIDAKALNLHNLF
ncbi:S8 family serine peptidase [bacterium]|nr:S8 family serine peptidase [bacterium]